jgi:hypothetical protein
LVQEREPSAAEQGQLSQIESIKRRVNALDNRLDNIDSMVTSVAERVMKQPITLNIVCPHCSKNIEITIIGSEKPGH